MKKSCTVIIYTRNEENNIQACISSAFLLTKDIIIIDMESTDTTVKIAKQCEVLVYSFPHKHYVEPARKFGIEKAQTDWVCILDADERITTELADEIKNAMTCHTYTHYKIPRKNIFAGTKWLKRGGWYPDYQVRLIKKSSFVTWSGEIHGSPQINGMCGLLHSSLVHYFHPNLENMVEKTIIYENIESDLLFHAGKKANTLVFFRKFWGELYRRLIRHVGFLDGSYGIIESVYQAFSKTITYLFVYEKNRGV